MPPASDRDAKIACPTSQHLQVELDALMAVLELREQEDTWEKMERAIIRFTGITRGGGYKHLPLFIDGMGKMGVGLKLGQCMLSDRGRLSGVATELLQTLAPRLGSLFQPLVPVYLAPLVQLLGRPNKVFLKRAEKCLWTIISNCHLPSILVELKRGLSDEAATCRRGCAAGFERALIDWERPQFGEKGVGILEEALRKVGADKDVEVRATGKRIWSKFSEIWPERVDEFSGPLTPTIRRYLGVSAAAASAQAGPSKPRTAPVRPAPSRPPPPAPSASTSSVTMAPPPPPPPPSPPKPIQMAPPPPPAPIGVSAARPQVIHGRAVRPPLLSTQSEAPIPHHAIDAPRPRRSPIRSAFPGGPAVPSTSDLGEPSRQRVMSSRAPRYPPGVLGLGQHGRSVSHSVLPLPELHGLPLEAQLHHPEVPSRPAFPTSFSTTSLPPITIDDPVASWQPTRRFPEAARPARPGLFSSTSELNCDALSGPSRPPLPPITPSVLRGAVRPTQQPKRDLGQAQRRIVTAPPLTEVSAPPQLAQVALGRSTSVRDRIVEMERKAAEVKEVEAREVPLPISPAAERFGGKGGSRSGTPSRLKEGREAESPLMPMLARSLRGKEETEGAEKKEGMLMDEDITEGSMGDVTFGEGQPSKPAAAPREAEEELLAEASETQPDGELPPQPTVLEVAVPIGQPPTAALPPAATSSNAAPTVAADAPPTLLPITKSTSSSQTAAAVPAAGETKARKAPLPPAATARPAIKPPPGPAAGPSEKLPPVAAARTAKPRLPANEPRKPFRPTTKAAAPSAAAPSAKAGVAAEPAPGSAPKEQAVRDSKPPLPPKAALPARVVSGTKAAINPPPKPSEPIVKPRVVSSGSNLTKPTASSQHRAAAPSTTAAAVPRPRVPSSSTSNTSTLPPPVKKDKVKRKAAVPSFRPTRTAESTFGKGTTSLSASTASLAASQRSTETARAGGAREIVAKVRVKPESVALPISPGETRAKEIPLPVSPASGGEKAAIAEFTGRVKVKARPENLNLELPVSSVELAAEVQEMEEPKSPLAAEIPLPPSPTASTLSPTTFTPPSIPEAASTASPPSSSDVLPSPTPSPLIHAASPSPAPTPKLNQLDLSPPSARTPLSKASTLPAGSDWAGSDSEEDMEIEEEEERVTFKESKVGKVVDLMGDEDEEEGRDLIEFSAPSRPVAAPVSGSGGEAEERDLIEFSAPSRRQLIEGEESVSVGKVEVGLSGSGKGSGVGEKRGELGLMVGSPRVVLSERNRNGLVRGEEAL